MNGGFRLVTLDLDYTLFMGNSVLFANTRLDISTELERFHADYRDGRISEKELNVLQSPLLRNVSLSKVFRVLENGPILKRLDRGVHLLQNNNVEVQMLSLNPFQLYFTKRVGIRSDVSMIYDLDGSDYLGEVKGMPDNKFELLMNYCLDRGIELQTCAHVGDSRNDIMTFRGVGYSVALNSSDAEVEREATVSLHTHNFLDVANTILRANDLT